MLYRPEYHLDCLRQLTITSQDDAAKPAVVVSTTTPPPHPQRLLRWLRTLVIDLSRTPKKTRPPHEQGNARLAAQLGNAASVAVEQCVLHHVHNDQLSKFLLPFLAGPISTTTSRVRLTALDLRACWNLSDCVLLEIATTQRELRRLYLPATGCPVQQSTLDHFIFLEELGADWCRTITNVDFCSASLRLLYANHCTSLSDVGLRRATRLEVLHVRNCRKVTDTSPFAHCLLELDARHGCGIGSAALVDCHRLQVLFACGNRLITSLQPFANRLRELFAASGAIAFPPTDLQTATRLVRLHADFPELSSLEPFAATLRELHVGPSAMIDDAGIRAATNLVCLWIMNNDRIHDFGMCRSTLLELGVRGTRCRVDDASLTPLSNLIWLELSETTRLTSVAPCGASLRHLVARFDCALTDEVLSAAHRLVTLDCSVNSNLCCIVAFQNSLQELITHKDLHAFATPHGNALAAAPGLARVVVKNPVRSSSEKEWELLGFECISQDQRSAEWIRETTQYTLVL